MDGLIDTGGMARVYRGTDEVLDRPVAIKILKHELAEDDNSSDGSSVRPLRGRR